MKKKPQNLCSTNRCPKVQRPEVLPPAAPLELSLKDALIRSVLNSNTAELTTEVTRIAPTLGPHGITNQKREAMRTNALGVTERIKEEVRHSQTLADGTAVTSDSVLVRCQSCRQIVNEESIQRCPCGKTCCISKKCGCYSEAHDQWFCCKKHALLVKLKVNLRWLP
ncbi:hypothetical protein KAR91_82335 [Candidatus Pacearchaeota archaeon]|nr:hypothetical protein [Candidatus Pacearchaeota archaeon]